MSKEEALETLTSLKADFDAAVKDAQEDSRQWRWLRRYGDPKAREEEFAGYATRTASVAELIGKDDKATAAETLKGMKVDFEAVAADCRGQATGIFESFFHLYEMEAQKFEGYSSAVEKTMKLL
jgi:hypothetical protein